MRDRGSLGVEKLSEDDIEQLDDQEFLIYLEGRFEHGDLGSLYNNEIEILSKIFYKKVDDSYRNSIENINNELDALESTMHFQIETNPLQDNIQAIVFKQIGKEYLHLFRYLFKQIQDAETQDELLIYYEFLQNAIKDFEKKAGYPLSHSLSPLLAKAVDQRFATLETENQHFKGALVDVGKMAVGAATYLPVAHDVYLILAWGEWGRSIMTAQALHPVAIGDRLSHAAKSVLDSIKKIPSFVKNHWKALLIGTLLVGGAAAAVGIFVAPLVVAVLAPVLTVATAFVIGGLALSAISAGIYKYKEYVREKRIAKRLDDCQKEINNVLKKSQEIPEPNHSKKNGFLSDLFIRNKLTVDAIPVWLKSGKSIAQRAMKILKQSKIISVEILQKKSELAHVLASLNEKITRENVLIPLLNQLAKIIDDLKNLDVGYREKQYEMLLKELKNECGIDLVKNNKPEVVQSPGPIPDALSLNDGLAQDSRAFVSYFPEPLKLR